MAERSSGKGPFSFTYRADLRDLPKSVREFEVRLHGGFAVDKRPGQGEVYYGMPGAGILRISADLQRQELIRLPSDLEPVNFHSTKIGEIDGEIRLFLPANEDAMVAIVSLDGKLDFVLSKPEFEEYRAEQHAFRPTDTVLVGDQLYVADGYGENYISKADVKQRAWTTKFGGKGSSEDNDKFGTAHGLNMLPSEDALAIADRPHSRVQIHQRDGRYERTHSLPFGSRPCGVDFVDHGGRTLAVIGSLDDPQSGRPAPIYVLDAQTFELLSTIRPKEELGVELADHLHNVVWHKHDGRLFLVCQAWNPGFFFVLEHTGSSSA